MVRPGSTEVENRPSKVLRSLRIVRERGTEGC